MCEHVPFHKSCDDGDWCTGDECAAVGCISLPPDCPQPRSWGTTAKPSFSLVEGFPAPIGLEHELKFWLADAPTPECPDAVQGRLQVLQMGAVHGYAAVIGPTACTLEEGIVGTPRLLSGGGTFVRLLRACLAVGVSQPECHLVRVDLGAGEIVSLPFDGDKLTPLATGDDWILAITEDQVLRLNADGPSVGPLPEAAVPTYDGCPGFDMRPWRIHPEGELVIWTGADIVTAPSGRLVATDGEWFNLAAIEGGFSLWTSEGHEYHRFHGVSGPGCFACSKLVPSWACDG